MRSEKKKISITIITNGKPCFELIPQEVFEALCKNILDEIITRTKEN